MEKISHFLLLSGHGLTKKVGFKVVLFLALIHYENKRHS